ncbi:DUF2971 domain-containing protein [Halorientalis halophila]|uniref:DUF2971 domain-containing protein n=1 Tax=Halorientalis halophila TaxID=3108499 RepID=UPI00300A08CF
MSGDDSCQLHELSDLEEEILDSITEGSANFDLSKDTAESLQDESTSIDQESGAWETWNPPEPSSESTLWRYIDFTQLVSLFEREGIWFSNIEEFSDPYEGSRPEGKIGISIGYLQEKLDISADEARDILEASESGIIAYVSCWHESDFESAALWDQYLQSDQGVAIETTVKDLKEAIEPDQNRDIVYGKVQYIDYDESELPSGVYPPIFHKRLSFQHEAEYRVAFTDWSQLQGHSVAPGQYISVDLDKLINTIHLAPTSPKWVSGLVERVMDRYEVDYELTKSTLYDSP